jgi:integrase/recombinase XerD
VVGKGSKTRTIRLDKKYYEWAVEFQQQGGESLSKNTPVFRSKNTLNKLTTVSVWKIVKNAALRAGLSSEVSPHWLRHSHATISLQLGDDLRVIQSTLGHDSIATTTKYTAVSPGKSSGQGIEI